MKGHTGCVFIYPKDVQQIMRKSERSARNLINKIKTALGKQKSQCITVSEFCKFMEIDEEAVLIELRL
jgi:hypothetical protein